MAKNVENIIMFPGWKENLENKSVQLINENKFKEALLTIDKIVSHNASTFNTNMLKLLCHVELGQYEEAIQYCESVLIESDYDYYTYLEFYLTILFQSNKFERVLEVYEDEKSKGTIPAKLKERFSELNKLSYQMVQQKKESDSLAYLKELRKMVASGNKRGQWEFINGLRNIGAEPSKEIAQLLTNDDVHPVTKTTIFNWLKEYDVNDVVEVSKFGKTIKIKPNNIEKIGRHPVLKKTKTYLIEIEQENPSLYELIEELLIRYIYVKYPLFYLEEDASYVADALTYIGRKNLQLPVNEMTEMSQKVTAYILEINKCNELYLSITGD